MFSSSNIKLSLYRPLNCQNWPNWILSWEFILASPGSKWPFYIWAALDITLFVGLHLSHTHWSSTRVLVLHPSLVTLVQYTGFSPKSYLVKIVHCRGLIIIFQNPNSPFNSGIWHFGIWGLDFWLGLGLGLVNFTFT